MTSLLALTSDEDEVTGLDEHFDEITIKSLADASIMSGERPEVFIDGRPISEYDAVYFNPEPKAAIYARVLLECLQEQRININLDPSTFFIMAKAFYLFKVLNEKQVDIPNTIVVSTEKGLTEVEKDIDFPVVAKKYEGFERIDTEQLDDPESLKSFAEHSEHGDHLILVQEFVEGEVYDALYIDGETVALKLEGEDWRLTLDNAGANYHNLSTEQQDIVTDAAESIGAEICRVRLVGDKVVQVESQPRLDFYRKESGKDVYGKVADFLTGDND